MKTTNQIFAFTLLAAAMFLIHFAGIIRDDVKEEEYLKLANQKQFDCVGIVNNDGSPAGSCVLIRDRYVLSAAHVFDSVKAGDVSRLYISMKGTKSRVKRVIIHPDFLNGSKRASYDIALVELDQPLTAAVPAQLNSLFDELNSRVVGVGYGASGVADRPDKIDFHNKKIAGENVIDSLGGLKHAGNRTVMFCDFDHPTRKDCNKMGSDKPEGLEYVCTGGDSGGGLFRQGKAGWELIGICRGGGVNIDQLIKSGYYGQVMEWTRVSVFNDWINNQMQ